MNTITSSPIYPETIKNIDLYHVDTLRSIPNLVHAIFTRRGGVSPAPYAALNLSTATGDTAANIANNLALACRSLNIRPQQTVGSRLVHGAEVLTVTKANRQQNVGAADGLITNTPGIFLSMRFADCTPLLLYDRHRVAVGLSHAGWRGTIKNITQATIAAMTKAFGSNPADIIGVIGPAIGPCCYEVGPEVIGAVESEFSQPDQLLTRRRNGHGYFDLGAANRQQLLAAGVGEVVESQLCTACHTDKFFSHRAEQGKTGRFGVILGIREAVAG